MRKTLASWSLVHVRIFSPLRLRLFILSVIVISSICSSSAAFLLGISHNIESIVGEEENTVIITASGITTPITSQVSTLPAIALRKCEGVLAVSTETLTLAILGSDSDFPVTVRGITPDYLLINQLSVKEGINPWDITLQNSSEYNTRGVVVGTTLAQNQNIYVGEKLVLTGTYASGSIEVEVVGIIDEDSHKEEILVPFWMGQILSGLRPGEATLLRVHFNPQLTSKEKIRSLMQTDFSVQLNLLQGNSTSPANFNVTVYDSLGKRIPSLSRNLQNDFLEYSLPFGIYEFSLCRDEPSNYANFTLFVDKDIMVNFNSLKINSYTLRLLFTQKMNATVSIWSPDFSESLQMMLLNSSQYCKFVLDEQELFISVATQSFTYISPLVHFDKSQFFLLDFNNTVYDSDTTVVDINDNISDFNDTLSSFNDTLSDFNDLLIQDLNDALSPDLNQTQIQDSWMFRIRCVSPSRVPIINATITLYDTVTQEVVSLKSNKYGMAEVQLSNNNHSFTVMYEDDYGVWKGNPCVNTTILPSKTPFAQIVIDPHINIEIIVQDEYYQPIRDVEVSIKGVFLGGRQSKATNINGSAIFVSLSWDKFVIEIDNSKIIRESILLMTSTTIMILYPSVTAAIEVAIDYSYWVGHRKYAVNNPKEYVSGFLATTFAFLNITILVLIALISTLVFLSFGPIISHPLSQSMKELEIMRQLGATLNQRRAILLTQLSLTSIGASFIGSLLGGSITLLFGVNSNNIIGGVVITPIFRPEIIIVVVLISFLVTAWNIYRTVKD